MDLKIESDTLSSEPIDQCEITFDQNSHTPVRLKQGCPLSVALNVENSPVLFGCRIGICGTCVIEVESSSGPLPPRTAFETETLDLYAGGNPKARLACQLTATTNMKIKKIAAF